MSLFNYNINDILQGKAFQVSDVVHESLARYYFVYTAKCSGKKPEYYAQFMLICDPHAYAYMYMRCYNA